MNAPFALQREIVVEVDLRQPDEAARIEAFVAEQDGSVFHRPAWLLAIEAGTGQRARPCGGEGRSTDRLATPDRGPLTDFRKDAGLIRFRSGRRRAVRRR